MKARNGKNPERFQFTTRAGKTELLTVKEIHEQHVPCISTTHIRDLLRKGCDSAKAMLQRDPSALRNAAGKRGAAKSGFGRKPIEPRRTL